MRRVVQAALTSLIVAGLVLLSACTGQTPTPSSSSAPSAAVPPGVQLSTDPAPSSSNANRAMRLDAVRRTGAAVRVDLTLGTGQGPYTSDFGPGSLAISTNDGLSVVTSKLEPRMLAPNSLATVSLQMQLPAATATALTVTWRDLPLTVPLPPADGAVVWRPAPLRQAGLAEPLLYSRSLGVVVDTIRSEGMVTEVTYRGWVNGESVAGAPCSFNFAQIKCKLVEPDGTVHPLLGHTSESHPGSGRSAGVLRFLGELKPATKALQLFLAANDPFDPIGVDLPSHADSPAQAVAGTLSRPTVTLAPARSVTHKQTGATFGFDRLDVLDDRVQLHVIATGGSKGLSFYFTAPAATLTEPSGVAHPLVVPAKAALILKPKGRMDVTLVFQGAIAPESTSLQLSLGAGAIYKPLNTTFTIPSVDPNPPAAEATLGQLDAPDTAPVNDPSLTATPAPSTAVVSAFTVIAAPTSTDAELGPIRTFIKGVSSGANTPDDPSEAEKADRTLEELGAKRTPDGWVLTLPETVLFDYNSADLRATAAATLSKVAALLQHFVKAKIGVNGHTDNTGTKDYNADLSTRRAQSVANALAGDGVTAGRMTVTGYGETRPIASNATDQGKQQNRRVEIVLRQAE